MVNCLFLDHPPLFFFFFFFFWLFTSHPWNMEVPRLGVKTELQLSATAQYSTVPQHSTAQYHSHSNSSWTLSVTYTTAHGNAGSSIHWARPGIEPATSEDSSQVHFLCVATRTLDVLILKGLYGPAWYLEKRYGVISLINYTLGLWGTTVLFFSPPLHAFSYH